MGIGRLTRWSGLIAPFSDRPDIQIPVIWYPAATPLQDGMHTVFTDRFYDYIDNWSPLGVGTVPGSLKPYFGPVPPSVPGPQVGSDADFMLGISYADYVASGGSPSTPCVATITDCPACPEGAYPVLYCVQSGWADQGGVGWSALNGSFALTYQGACTWVSAPIALPGVTDLYYLTWRFVVNGWVLGLVSPTPASGATVTWLASAWDCRSDVTPGPPIHGLPFTPPLFPVISTSPSGVPDMPATGTIFAFGGSAPPVGAVRCDGASYPQTAPYNNLFAVIGHTWDTYRGQSSPSAGTFRVPLLSGQVVGAAGAAVAGVGPVPGTQSRALALAVGEEAHTLTPGETALHDHPVTDPGHTHGVTDPGHTHALATGRQIIDAASPGVFAEQATLNPVGTATDLDSDPTGVSVDAAATGLTVGTGPAGGGGAHNNMQPTGFVLYCIQL